MRHKIVKLTGESSRDEAFGHLKTIPIWNKSKAQEDERQQPLYQPWEGIWTIKSTFRQPRERPEERKQIPTIGSECRGSTII
jgi:hypothetical protein